MSDTPITDRKEYEDEWGYNVVDSDLAREFEIENAKVRKENEELLKDKDRLDWLLNEYGVRWDIINDDRITREGIDKEMTDSGYKNMEDYNVNTE